MTTRPNKPVKPRIMWQTEHDQHTSICLNCANAQANYTRPVLVIDLSHESVEALMRKVKIEYLKSCSYYYEGAFKDALAAIGITARKGRK